MTREEAIKFANCLKNNYTIDFNDMADFCEMAIKALEQQPKTEGARGDIPLQQSVPEMPQPSEHTETHACDCISREAVLDALHSCFAEGFNEDRWWNSTYVLDVINKVPSIQPQPKEEPQQKTGHWTHDGSSWKNRWICSECGYKLYDEQSRFCPDCGIKMESEAKE